MDIKIKLGKRIQSIRNEKGIKQQELADLTGFNRVYLSDVERGKKNITIENIERIADALNINIKDLF